MLIVAFSYSIYFIGQAAFGLPTTGIYFQTYSGLLAIISVFLFVANRHNIPLRAFNNVLVISVSVVVLFYITRFFYDKVDVRYEAYFLSMGVRFVPALLAGTVMLKSNLYLRSMEKAMLPFVLFYTVVLAKVIFSAKIGVNIGASFNLEGGMNYQNMSYYSIFAFGMTLYMFSYGHFGTFLRYAILVLAFLQVIMTLMTGGRGAFVLAIIFAMYFGTRKFSMSRIVLYVIITVVLCVILQTLLTHNAVMAQGMGRIMNFFNSSNSVMNDNRWVRWGLAWDAFLDSPICGHGLGSVFYKVGFYSHNILTDILCEGGIVLLIFFIILLLKFYKCSKYLIKKDARYIILTIIFLCSFVSLLFSGYYLANSGLWFALAYILNKYTIVRSQHRKLFRKKCRDNI